MARQTRPCLIVGNWKMYKTIDQALEFLDAITPLAKSSSAQVMLAVPYTAIKPMADKAKGTEVIIGAQNMNDATEGAFTGEVAAIMLKEAGAQFVLLGHSERRKIFHETDELINRKLLRALESSLQPILCIGETYEERQAKKTEEVITHQLSVALQGVNKEQMESLVIAYEPVWAIGTGLAATPELAEKAIETCRKVLSEQTTAKAATKVPVIYGGSVTEKNAESYLDSSSIDGLLIGSASLAVDSFAKIVALRQNK